MWDLSKKDQRVLKELEHLTPEEIAVLPDAGDGKAVFFDEGSHEEYEELLKEDKGLAGWYKRIRNL